MAKKSNKEPRFVKVGTLTHDVTVKFGENELRYVSNETGDDVPAIRAAGTDTKDKDFILIFRDKKED